jgi:chromosome segregation ATPase
VPPPPPPNCDPVIPNETPADQLRRLKECLAQAQKVKSGVEGDIARFDAQVKQLDTFVADLEKIVAAYDKEQRRLEEEQKCLQGFRDNEETRLSQELGGAVNEIAGKVKPFKDELETLRQRVMDWDTELAELKNKQTEAKQKEADAKAEFERQKKTLELIGARHKKLDSLRDQVVKLCAPDQKQLAFAYWLVTTEKLPSEDSAKDKLEPRFKEKLKEEPQVVITSDLRGKLTAAWTAYATAITNSLNADAKVKERDAALATLKTELEGVTKKFDANIQAALLTIKPK